MHEEARKRITGLLYDGVMSRDDWYGGIDALRDALGAGFFHFFTLNTTDSTVLDSVDNQTSVGAIQKKLREYEDDGYVTHDLRMQILSQLPVGEVMLDHEHISAKEMSRNRVYADFLGTFGFRNTLGVLLRDDAGVRDYLGFIRPADYTAYGAGDKGLMQQLMPDLVRASQLRARMAELSQRAALGLASLQTLPQGMVVVDANCRIQFANAAAEQQMTSHGAFSVVQGQLQCPQESQQSRMQQLVAQACARGASKAGAFNTMARLHPDTRIVVTVLPLKSDHALNVRWQMPLALVVMTLPGTMQGVNPQMVADMLGLSGSEARMLLLLASGKTVKDFSVVEGCSWHTARTHLKNLMNKTGCHRQVELVQLLQALQLG